MTAYPQPTSTAVTKRMRANRRKDTRPEVAVRSALHGAGLRFFVDRPVRLRDRVVRPDIVFPRARIAVFVDGCYWHACPEHGTQPMHNVEYWTLKLRRNVERDRAVDAGLVESGWFVLRCWEHEAPEAVAVKVRRAWEGAAGSGHDESGSRQ
jgi:DNA mismatch endonuclease, patch repair protein